MTPRRILALLVGLCLLGLGLTMGYNQLLGPNGTRRILLLMAMLLTGCGLLLTLTGLGKDRGI